MSTKLNVAIAPISVAFALATVTPKYPALTRQFLRPLPTCIVPRDSINGREIWNAESK